MHINNLPEAAAVMDERFGCDSLIALATVDGAGTPWVRSVNGYYEDGSFYVITHRLSNKMRHLTANPVAAVCGEWFTAHALGEDMGHIRALQNEDLADKLRTVFAEWYGNGHTDETDPNTIILRLKLTDGVLFSHGTRWELEFN
ncbi:MAG: pyridoxamine 5'-phosphate oxidase family protein [Eubacteriales bacterium]|nr:pyridoxamine 5'-phosphate oxidase family protein [Eubacteriales bacterium]